jgi:hypothetical protein
MRFSFTRRLIGSLFIPAAVLTIAAPTTTIGCKSDEGGACQDFNPAVDTGGTPISFSGQVFPIFKNSCAFSSCHGSVTGNPNGVFLGGDDPKKVHLALVDVRASRLQSMSFVKAGAPHDSFLMRKLDGSHCVLDPQCDKGDCGDSMPRNEETLDQGTRDTIRKWIAQGAANN